MSTTGWEQPALLLLVSAGMSAAIRALRTAWYEHD